MVLARVGRPPVQPRRAVLRRQAGADLVAGTVARRPRLRAGRDRRRRRITRSRPIRAGHGLQTDLHDLQLTARGTALVTAYETTTADLSSIGGSSQGQVFVGHVQEVDLTTGARPVRLEQPRSRRDRRELSAAPAQRSGLRLLPSQLGRRDGRRHICSSAPATRARSTRSTARPGDPLADGRQALGLQRELRCPLLVAARCPSSRVFGDHRVRQRGAG